MVATSTLLLFIGAAAILAAMPGLGMFYIAGRTLSGGRNEGIASCLGTALGKLVHVIAGAAGVSALLMASANAFAILKLAGGAYLMFLGIQAWQQAVEPIGISSQNHNKAMCRAMRQGFVVEATNPKTAAFFLALIPQFIDPAAEPVAMQFTVFGLISIALNTTGGLAVVFAASSVRAKVAECGKLISRLRLGSAAILVNLGVSLLLTRRPV
jgi:threonine/homoserine/homoserine lactone efflux protein